MLYFSLSLSVSLSVCLSGQASDLDLARLELREVRDEVVRTLAKHTEKTIEQVSEDIKRPIYMKPEKAIEYGLIDKVLEESL